MSDFRDPGFDDRPTGAPRGVWTTRPPTSTEFTALATARTGLAEPTAAAPEANQSPIRRILRYIRIFLRVALIGLTALGALITILIFTYRWVAPPTTTLMLAQKITGTTIDRAWRPLAEISPHLARAVIMSEDAGFCGHRGVDFTELARAYERGLEGGSQGGGSTIAMQVSKNLFLWPSKSYVRKALEIPMTLAADRWWGKRRTLEIYLNIAEWGPGIFGAEAAARAYFNKPASELTEWESALLAVALPNPLARNAANPASRQRRMATVIQTRMRAGANNVRCLTRAAS